MDSGLLKEELNVDEDAMKTWRRGMAVSGWNRV